MWAIYAATALEVFSILAAYWIGRQHGAEDEMVRKMQNGETPHG